MTVKHKVTLHVTNLKVEDSEFPDHVKITCIIDLDGLYNSVGQEVLENFVNG